MSIEYDGDSISEIEWDIAEQEESVAIEEYDDFVNALSMKVDAEFLGGES